MITNSEQGSPLLFAVTSTGLRVPVIDITHPAFALAVSDDELQALARGFIDQQSGRAPMSPALQEALDHSLLGAQLRQSAGTYLGGVGAYLMKLGPGNLPDAAGEIDRRIAASFPAFAARIRLQDTAILLAEAVASRVHADDGRPLLFVNVGGGPAADTLNALVLLQRAHARLLRNRKITILVLDVDDEGPAFGARVLEALRSNGAPLHSIAATFEHVRFDWADANGLRAVLGRHRAAEALTAMSSEGALFEYGDDQEIVQHLRAFGSATSADAVVCGSATRDTEATRALASQHAVRPRSAEAFAALVAAAGWRIDRSIGRPFSDHLRLTKPHV